MKNKWICSLISGIALWASANTGISAQDWIPDVLVPWKNWVLFDEKNYDCPYVMNNVQQRYCAWPSVLQLTISSQGAHFSQTWQVFNESWIDLPGNNQLWPQQVTVEGKPAVVLNVNNVPRVLLKAGTYQVTGQFDWQQEPSAIALPSLSRLVALYRDNQQISAPVVDEAGRLWLNNTTTAQPSTNQDQTMMRVFRQIHDTVPMTIETLIQLDVSGKAREMTIGPALLPHQVPTAVESTLPVKLDQSGLLTLQVQPGTWNVILRSHATQQENQIERPPLAKESHWPADELWVFRAAPEIRTVKLQGIPQVDPTQTLLPQTWQNLPAFRVVPNQKLALVIEQRGQTDQQNQLTRDRKVWIDFSGNGYTIVDNLNGIMQTDWRVEQTPPLKLGRVEIDGEMQLLTQLPASQNVGVEVRSRQLNLTAVSRQNGAISTLPSNGWNVNFDSSNTQINLPPGWRLLGIMGADNTEGTWWDSWNVLDAFIVCLISIAIGKLGGIQKGLLSFITLVLMHGEPGAPYFIWLNIILAAALLRFFTEGKMHKLAQYYKLISFACLFLIAVPFMFQQIQTALYPQTDPLRSAQWSAPVHYAAGGSEMALMAKSSRDEAQPMAMMAMPASMPAQDNRAQDQLVPQKEKYVAPGIIQTGPAIPIWHWNTARFSNAALTAQSEAIRLFYLEPTMTRIINIVRVILLLLLVMRLWEFSAGKIRWYRASSVAVVFMVGIVFSLIPRPASAAEIPSPALLNILKERLLKPAVCAPYCAAISEMSVSVDNNIVTLRLQIQAGTTIAIPIPGDNNWLLQEIYLDGKPAAAISPSQQQLLVGVTEGTHELVMKGAMPNRDNVTIITPLIPLHITIQNSGEWQIPNVAANLLQGNGIQFIRMGVTRKNDTNETNADISPYVQVQRHFSFDKKITVETEVKRVAPQKGVINIAIPLLPNERVIEEGFAVENNAINVNIAADQNRVVWHSILPETQTDFTLQAPNSNQFTEVWQFSVSPLWHLKTTGFSAIANNFQPNWLPTWFPWPGETLQVQLAMPAAVPGNTFTIMSAQVHNDVGQRELLSSLNLRVRSSLGGQHSITLPKGAKVTQLSANHLPIPINQVDQKVILPLLPGLQDFQIQWREANTSLTQIKTPWVDIGASAANTVMSMRIPENRWVIAAGGAAFGPSVMVWSLLIGMCILGFGLWRFSAIPLKLHDWVLLALGVSTALPLSLLLLILWFALLMSREKWGHNLSRLMFNLSQIGIVLFTVIVFLTLIGNLGYGLLGDPQMWIQSFNPLFIDYISAPYQPFLWYVDHAPKELPQGWIISLPLWLYRALMLAWSLWFAFAIIRWLRWGWERYSRV